MNAKSMKIISINVGKPININYQGKELSTGLYKDPTDSPLFLSSTNFAGDAQADLINHGGKDKAVCVYPYEHYPYWEKELGKSLTFGAFGENLTTFGMLEEKICIGDIFQTGEAIVQVSQPRQPCHKLAKRYDVNNLPIQVQNTGFTGFYLRVLQEGLVSKDQGINLLERHHQGVTVAFANRIMHHDKNNIEDIKRILDVAELSQSWRETLLARLDGHETSISERLTGKI